MYYRKYLFKDYTKLLNKLAMSNGVFEVNQVFFHEQNQLIKLESRKTTMCRLEAYKIDHIGISNQFDIDINPNGYQDGSFYVNPTDQSYYYSMFTKLLGNFTPLSKFRYKPIPDNEFVIEYVDIYPDLVLMVFEFTTVEAMNEFVTPSFCGKEVTHDKEYDDYNMYRKLVDKPKIMTIAGKELKITDVKDFDYNIIQTKDDILTKDLEECNENTAVIKDIILNRTIKAGEAIQPSDFKLDYVTDTNKLNRDIGSTFTSNIWTRNMNKKKKKGRPKGSTNKKRKGYAWMDLKGVVH